MKTNSVKSALVVLFILAGWIFCSSAWAGELFAQTDSELTDLSLEELMEVEVTVTSVSKKKEKLFETPAAVYVVTQEEIRRSGATTIPEALRMVPGLNVAQFDSNTWAVSARGFNFRFANKLLILMDGRTVYNQIFSGVFWDTIDTVLEDIDRIEVVRGPGGTLWGANAVNGVINIITKSAKKTEGGLISAGAGTVENGFATLRYGDKLSPEASYRVYGKYYDRDEFEEDTSTTSVQDDWHAGRGGFRIDWDATSKNSFTFQGDYYDGVSGQRLEKLVRSTVPPLVESPDDEERIDGGNFIARWTRELSSDSDLQLQFFYTRERRRQSVNTQATQIDTFDLDFQHHFRLGKRHELIWGTSSRWYVDSIQNTPSISFSPSNDTNYRFDGFLQDKISFYDDRLHLTIGSKLEHNTFSGFEFQPNARLGWTPNDRHTVWSAVSRAVRIPNRSSQDVTFNVDAFSSFGVPTAIQLQGNKNSKSLEVLAFEAGYRFKPNNKIFFDFAWFYNFYDELQSLERGSVFLDTTAPSLLFVAPINTLSNLSGEAYGVELAVKTQPLDWWQLNGSLSTLNQNFESAAGSGAHVSEAANEGRDPEIQWSLRSLMDLPYDLEFDTSLYFVSDLATLDVPQYARVDVRLGWSPTDNLEFSLSGVNLQDEKHPETMDFPEVSIKQFTEVPRSFYGKVTWRF